MAYTWAPTTSAVALVIARLTVDANGADAADFTDTTTPTTTQAQAVINAVTEEVAGAITTYPGTTENWQAGTVPPGLEGMAADAAAVGAASRIALSFYPEGETLAAALEQRYQSALTRLVAAVERVLGPGSDLGGGGGGVEPTTSPVWSFPVADEPFPSEVRPRFGYGL